MALEVVLTRVMQAPPAKVWAAVSTQETLRRWFSQTITITPEVGGRWEMTGVHGSTPFHFGGVVQEWEPLRRIVMTWNWVPPRWPADSLFAIELQPEGEATRVTLRHYNWEAMNDPELTRRLYESFSRGWSVDEELKDLAEYLEQAA